MGTWPNRARGQSDGVAGWSPNETDPSLRRADVPTAAVGVFVVTRLVTSSVRERFVNQLFEASRVAADAIVRRESAHLVDLRLLAYTEGVPRPYRTRTPTGLQDMIWPLVLNNNMELVSALNLQGVEILGLVRNPADRPLSRVSGAGLLEPANRRRGILDEVEDARATSSQASSRRRYGAYLFTSAPVRDAAGTLVGVMMTATRVQSLLAEIKAQSLADVVVLESAGRDAGHDLGPARCRLRLDRDE